MAKKRKTAQCERFVEYSEHHQGIDEELQEDLRRAVAPATPSKLFEINDYVEEGGYRDGYAGYY